MSDATLKIGSVTITAIVDTRTKGPCAALFPSVGAGEWEAYRDFLLDDCTNVPVTITSYLVRSNGKTILVDTGIGAKNRQLIHSVRSALRKRFPTANELVYDYGFSLVIGYSPTENGIESIVSSSCRAEGMSVYFMHGPQLPDPKKLLQGSAKLVRFIPVEAASRLKHPDVEALIAAAIDKATVPLPSKGGGGLVIKTFGPKKKARPKRPK